MTEEPELFRAHRHSIRHRDEILASVKCGCFYCCKIFPPTEIISWCDEAEDDGVGQTAICPYCDIDSIIGSEAGFPLTKNFLKAMQAHWF